MPSKGSLEERQKEMRKKFLKPKKESSIRKVSSVDILRSLRKSILRGD
jgi:hypothetical protein